jgi:hypothetical protein
LEGKITIVARSHAPRENRRGRRIAAVGPLASPVGTCEAKFAPGVLANGTIPSSSLEVSS